MLFRKKFLATLKSGLKFDFIYTFNREKEALQSCPNILHTFIKSAKTEISIYAFADFMKVGVAVIEVRCCYKNLLLQPKHYAGRDSNPYHLAFGCKVNAYIVLEQTTMLG